MREEIHCSYCNYYIGDKVRGKKSPDVYCRFCKARADYINVKLKGKPVRCERCGDFMAISKSTKEKYLCPDCSGAVLNISVSEVNAKVS